MLMWCAPSQKNMIMHFCFVNWIIIKIFSLREKAYPLSNVKSFYFCCFAKCSKVTLHLYYKLQIFLPGYAIQLKEQRCYSFTKENNSEIVTTHMDYKIACWKNMVFIKINLKRV